MLAAGNVFIARRASMQRFTDVDLLRLESGFDVRGLFACWATVSGPHFPCQAISDRFRVWKGKEEQVDDVLLIVVQV